MFKYASNLTPQKRRTFANRLLRLRDYLKTVKDSKYDHCSLVEGVDKKHPCGTTACAMGHAVVSGKFPKLNARLRGGSFETHCDVNVFITPEDVVDNKTGKEFNAAIRANKYFGPKSWREIFDDGGQYRHSNGDIIWNVTRKNVIARMTQFVKERYGVTTIR